MSSCPFTRPPSRSPRMTRTMAISSRVKPHCDLRIPLLRRGEGADAERMPVRSTLPDYRDEARRMSLYVRSPGCAPAPVRCRRTALKHEVLPQYIARGLLRQAALDA